MTKQNRDNTSIFIGINLLAGNLNINIKEEGSNIQKQYQKFSNNFDFHFNFHIIRNIPDKTSYSKAGY